MRRTFQEVWPELEQGLRGALRYQGARPEEADDIVQETALRLFRMWEDVDEDRSPRGLAFTIAWNLLRDERRKGTHLQLADRVPDEVRDDVERAGLARFELGRVLGALATLDVTYRRALLAEIAPHDTARRPSGAMRMIRMRARKRLASLLEAASGFAASAGVRWRRAIAVSHEVARVSAPVAGGSVAALGTAFIFSFVGAPVENTPADDREFVPQARPAIAVGALASSSAGSLVAQQPSGSLDAPQWSAADPGPATSTTRHEDGQGQGFRFGVGDEEGPNAGGSVSVTPGGLSSVPHCGARLQVEIIVGVDCSGDVGGQRVQVGLTVDSQEL